MRWNKKEKTKIRDKKTVIRFALFPVRLDDKHRVWWERYEKVYEYQNVEKEEPLSIFFDVTKTVYYKEWVLIFKDYIKK